MKRLLIGCLLAVLAVPAFAVIGTVDDVPAATLLLPYFEVDLDSANGITTLMSINNASAGAVLAHVVVWTDLSVHVLDFDIYLTGYDVQTINLRDIFVNGVLPVTADDPNDGSDLISPQGPASDDISYSPTCDDYLPYSVPALNADFLLNHLQPALTGGPSTYTVPPGRCSGIDHADRIARGYVTVDTVSDCNVSFPGDEGFFENNGTGIVTNQNFLWGDYFYVNPGENFAQGETLVHIEADAALVNTINASYSFYYRYTNLPVFRSCALGTLPGCDNREGLGNVFAARYLNNDVGFNGGTDFLVWRDAKERIPAFSCSLDYPNPYPLGANQIVLFDEEENFEVPELGCTISPCPPPDVIPTPFPWEAQRTHVGGPNLPASYDYGWAYLNLNFDTTRAPWPIPPGNTWVMQNWVTVTMDADGRYSVGFDALQLGNVTVPGSAPNDCIYPNPPFGTGTGPCVP